MEIGQIAQLAFGIAIFVTLFAIGLRTHPSDALFLLRHWQKGLRAFGAIFLAVPAAVLLMCYFFPLPPAAEAALIALSVAPMLPILPNDITKLGVSHSYTVSLEVIGVFVALIAAPVAFWIVSVVEGINLDIAAGPLLTSLSQGVLLPLALGVAVNLISSSFAQRISIPLTAIAGIVLLVCVLILLWRNWGYISTAFSIPLLGAIVALIVTGLVAGHLIGGPHPAERAAVALTASSRHIGFAIAVGMAAAPNSLPLVAGTILIYFVVRGLVVLPYTREMTRRNSAAQTPDAISGEKA